MSTAVQIPPLTTPLAGRDGRINDLWSRWVVQTQQVVTTATAPADGPYLTTTANATLTNETNLGLLSAGHLKMTVAAGVAAIQSSATIPSTDLTGALPALDGSALTSLASASLTGALPAISGAALTALPNPLPVASGVNLTALKGTAVTHQVVTKVFADSPYTVLATDETVLVNAVGGAVTITLPSATAGRILCVKKTDASANAVTLSGTVDGVANPTLGAQNQSRIVQGDGSGWQILSAYL